MPKKLPLHEAIRAARGDMSTRALADAMGIGQAGVSRRENGHGDVPIWALVDIATATGTRFVITVDAAGASAVVEPAKKK